MNLQGNVVSGESGSMYLKKSDGRALFPGTSVGNIFDVTSSEFLQSTATDKQIMVDKGGNSLNDNKIDFYISDIDQTELSHFMVTDSQGTETLSDDVWTVMRVWLSMDSNSTSITTKVSVMAG